MGNVTQLPPKSGPGVGHRPRKRAGELANVSVENFASDDEVTNLEALKMRMSQMLARGDISERDFAAISKGYREVVGELKEARDRAAAAQLGRRNGMKVAGGRDFRDF